MSVFGDIVKESRYIDDKIYVSFDEENYRRLELKLKMQEQEIERLSGLINIMELSLNKKSEVMKEVREYVSRIIIDETYTKCILEILDKENK